MSNFLGEFSGIKCSSAPFNSAVLESRNMGTLLGRKQLRALSDWLPLWV